MTGLKPPPDIPPARLFRSLLRLPRPVERIGFRFEALPDKVLWAQAITSLEVAEARDSADALLAMTASALVDGAGKRVATVADLGLLTQAEAKGLQAAVVGALARISPSYTISDSEAWGAQLKLGAAEPANLRTASVMGGCFEQAGKRIYAAPEKFYGVPRGQLLDGHWMAFLAAQEAYEQRRPKG